MARVGRRIRHRPGCRRIWTAVFTFFVAMAAFPAAADELGCGPRQMGDFGPFDYRDHSGDTIQKRRRIEKFHFFADVSGLNETIGKQAIGSNLEFVLRYFPNHHRALQTLSRFAEKTGMPRPPGMSFDIECWFARGEAMAPDDGMVPLLYGLYLLKKGNAKEAIDQFESARAVGGESLNLYYNLGLAYFDLKRYGESREMAEKAYALGHPLPGLRNKLERVGQWKR